MKLFLLALLLMMFPVAVKCQFVGLSKFDIKKQLAEKGTVLRDTIISERKAAACVIDDYGTLQFFFDSENKCSGFLIFPDSAKNANTIIAHLNEHMISEQSGVWKSFQNGLLIEHKLYYVDNGGVIITVKHVQ